MIGVAVGALLLVVAVGSWQAASHPSAKSELRGGGGSAASFSLTSLEEPNGLITLRQFSGRPLVINFWASWCIPCRTEMPALQAAYRQYGSKIDFVGIDINDTQSDARKFVAQVGVTYPTAFDPNGSMSGPYGLFGLPTTVMVDAAGRIVGVHDGGFTSRTLRLALRQAFPTSS